MVRNDPYVGLANRWFQPLTHLSNHTTLCQTGLQRYGLFFALQDVLQLVSPGGLLEHPDGASIEVQNTRILLPGSRKNGLYYGREGIFWPPIHKNPHLLGWSAEYPAGGRRFYHRIDAGGLRCSPAENVRPGASNQRRHPRLRRLIIVLEF